MGKSSGSGGNYSSVPVDNSQSNELMAQYMAMMESSMSSMSSMQSQISELSQPSLLDLPVVSTTEQIDWTEKLSQLEARARGETELENTRRKGRSDTIATSPLLDEEDAVTTGSILT